MSNLMSMIQKKALQKLCLYYKISAKYLCGREKKEKHKVVKLLIIEFDG